jgi:hypothetical protein
MANESFTFDHNSKRGVELELTLSTLLWSLSLLLIVVANEF